MAAKLLKGQPVDCIAVPLEMNTMVFKLHSSAMGPPMCSLCCRF